MISWTVLLAEILFLLFTSKIVFNSLFLFFHKLFKSQKVAISAISIVFFPGVVIHELSHMLVAEALFVKTFGLELVPEMHEGKVKMGSVKIAESDIFRRFAIGIAPLIIGGIFLASIALFLLNDFSFSLIASSPFEAFKAAVLIWAIFFTTNTMFSSRKDMDGAIEAAAIVAVLVLALMLAKVDVAGLVSSFAFSEQTVKFIWEIDKVFAVPVVLNLFFTFFALIFLRQRLRLWG
ncbi:MAG: hypothetical protein COU27_01605 [Candidatus Levybacteria bacterium CG10_big_fil_rev_8_21_14_0_10_36_7]|nr:MAG: hypothetical protein COU27_01605 [Candidatus Levybacteria bacterium CG10_big_fil_rev_8_21_14_0_10_36_7]